MPVTKKKPLKVTCSKCKREISLEALRKALREEDGYSCACRRRLEGKALREIVEKIDRAIAARLDEKPDPKVFSRGDGPSTSSEAAEELVAKLPEARRHALEAVRQYPGSTVKELADKTGDDDNRRIGRRLNELEKAGIIRRAPARKCSISGRRAATWYPA